MRLLELIAYHGTDHEFDTFNPVNKSAIWTTLGDEPVDRHGIFFTTNKDFAAIYGKVGAYELDVHRIADLDVMGELLDPFANMLWEAGRGDLARDAVHIWLHSNTWELFDEELGEYMVKYLVGAGYDAARFDEEGEEVYVVFDPSKVTKLKSDLGESFFADNYDILMPIVRRMMKTGLRPVIFKLWKRSPNAALAAAALKKLHDQGDENPIVTLMQVSDLDVPMPFLRRLAWDIGLRNIPGVGDKPTTMLSGGMSEDQGQTMEVYHITHDKNLARIRRNGLVPKIGANSQDLGEKTPQVHVFLDRATMEDALMNWSISWNDEDEDGNYPDISVLTLEVPRSWVVPFGASWEEGTATINRTVPPRMIKSDVAEAFIEMPVRSISVYDQINAYSIEDLEEKYTEAARYSVHEG